jgi:hypothetical protein
VATDLFARTGKFERQTRDVLDALVFAPAGVKVGDVVAAQLPDALGVAPVLRRMSRQDRAVVLGDVLNIIVGESTIRQGFMGMMS